MEQSKKVDWFGVSREYWEGNQEEIEEYCRGVEWVSLPCELPMGPGMAIKSIIKEFEIPKVDVVAYSHNMAPFGLLGIRGHYGNGNVNLFFVDEGVSVSPLCAIMLEET